MFFIVVCKMLSLSRANVWVLAMWAILRKTALRWDAAALAWRYTE